MKEQSKLLINFTKLIILINIILFTYILLIGLEWIVLGRVLVGPFIPTVNQVISIKSTLDLLLFIITILFWKKTRLHFLPMALYLYDILVAIILASIIHPIGVEIIGIIVSVVVFIMYSRASKKPHFPTN